ncbi:auxin-responsive protein SAUR71-like [Impatiens glandulifera]|uniref:auxin-responsive protein SAUR71-like n=1 Tax=Impatiens glandulifera TaxID=253017 RepID=UPI001FB07001|nr:auxin-responsive protein SAUR71-like [Impatiens glandulifera]
MKNLMRRFSRVMDSSQYSLLQSSVDGAVSVKSRRSRPVPEGHVPLYVGEEMERFIISARLLNHPIFVKLLNKSAQEYGYDQEGALRIPCHVHVFERILEALRVSHDDHRSSSILQDLLNSISISDDFQFTS